MKSSSSGSGPKRGVAVAVIAAVVLVAGSVGATLWFTGDHGSHGGGELKPTSMASWQAELASTGLEPSDPARLWNLIKADTCKSKDYDLYVTLGRGPEAMTLNQERIGIKHACPDRLEDWDSAITKLGETSDRVDYLCSTPLEELSEDPGKGGISDRENAMIVCDQYQGPEWEDYYNEHFGP